MKFHFASVVCLNWVEDRKKTMDVNNGYSTYEDRTARFFPPAPRVPRTAGLVPGDSSGFMDESDDSFRELFDSSRQQFDILCSGDNEGYIYLNIFGIFPIGKVNIRGIAFHSPQVGNHGSFQLMDASICKVAQQASNVEHLIEVIRKSIAIMSKQWSDAMHVYHVKFNALSSLIVDHGLDSSPQEVFLSLLGGARTSPPIHQFLVSSLGEAGLKRVGKAVSGAGKELQTIVLDHLQACAVSGYWIGREVN